MGTRDFPVSNDHRSARKLPSLLLLLCDPVNPANFFEVLCLCKRTVWLDQYQQVVQCKRTGLQNKTAGAETLIPTPCRILLQTNSKLVPRTECGLAIEVHYLHFWSARFSLISVIESSSHTQRPFWSANNASQRESNWCASEQEPAFWIKTIKQTTLRGSKHPEEQTDNCLGSFMWSRISFPRNQKNSNCSHYFSFPDTL